MFSIKSVASSVITFFCLIDKLYKSLNLKACGVWVKIELSRFKLNIWFLILYLIASFDLIAGITALCFFSVLINFFKSFRVKSGLAASCIKTLVGLYFLINFKAINEESDLSLPPLITKTFFGNFSLIWFILLTTIIIFLKSFDFKTLSRECL